MPRSKTWEIAALAVLPLATPAPSLADEAYICEGGRIQYVNSYDLPAKKLSDPCIAGYYGLLPMPPSNLKEINEKKADPVIPPFETKVVAVAERPVAKPPKAQPPALKKLQDRVEPERDDPARTAAVAASNSDFRNVHVINAVTGENQWFRHGR
jgi:hypothetical protein